MFEYAFDLNNNLTKLAVLTANGTNVTEYTCGKDNQPDTVIFSNGMNYFELRKQMLKRE